VSFKALKKYFKGTSSDLLYYKIKIFACSLGVLIYPANDKNTI
jgi:hypothetical protein